jgi:hypothetical protein
VDHASEYQQHDAFIPPAAEGLPLAALDSARNGATMLDAFAETKYGRNFLAHALAQLTRDGWLRTEPGEGFEPREDPAAGGEPRRGDGFEQWLKTQRDAAADYPEAYQTADGLLDLYRLHADTRTPLTEHVCEGRVAGDCECLETTEETES